MHTLSYSKDTLIEFNEMIKEYDEKIETLEEELENAKKFKKRKAIYFYCGMTGKTSPDNIIEEAIKNKKTEIQNLKNEREALEVGLERYTKKYQNEIEKDKELENKKNKERSEEYIEVIKDYGIIHTKTR